MPGGGHGKLGVGAAYGAAQAVADRREYRKTGLATESQLLNATLTVQEDADYEPGARESAVVKVEGDGRAIVKPGVTSKGLFTYDTASTEPAAYHTAQLLGYGDLVPPTVHRGDSSVQAWVEDAKMGCDLPIEEWQDVDVDSYRHMAVLDGIIGNLDRHGGNFLIKDGKVIGIDHGVSFAPRARVGESTWSAQVRWERRGRGVLELADVDRVRIRQLLSNKEYEQYIRSTLGGRAWEGIVRRGGRMIEVGF